MMNNSIQIAVNILTALLTGGFLLFFVEIMHVESDVRQRFKSIMNPFYHKLSKLAVFASYMKSSMTIPDVERGKLLTEDLNIIRKAGLISCSSGRDIPFMTSGDLESLCETINDVWYQLDNSSNLMRNIVVHDGLSLGLAAEALSEVDYQYYGRKMDVATLSKVMGDFYVEQWQPVEHCTPNFEFWTKKALITRVFVISSVAITMLSLIVTMLWADCISPIIPCSLAIFSSSLFAISIGFMIYLLSLKERLFHCA